MPYRLLIASDSRILREALRDALATDAHARAVEASAVVEAATEQPTDVVLLDVVGTEDRLPLIARLRQAVSAEIVALAGLRDDGRALAALREGALAYLHRGDGLNDLRRTLHAASAGRVLLSSEAADHLVRSMRPTTASDPLTERESQVLHLLATGRSNREIAHDLQIGEKTVKTHVSNVLAKLGVASRTQAAVHALAVGLVPRPD